MDGLWGEGRAFEPTERQKALLAANCKWRTGPENERIVRATFATSVLLRSRRGVARSVLGRAVTTLPCRGTVGSPKAIRGGVAVQPQRLHLFCRTTVTPSRRARARRPPPSRGQV